MNKQIEGIFPQNLTNYLIRVKLKEIVKLQDIIKNDDLNYKWKHRKTYNLGKFSLFFQKTHTKDIYH